MRAPGRAFVLLLGCALGVALAATALVVLTDEDGPPVGAGASRTAGHADVVARLRLSAVLPRRGVGGGWGRIVRRGRSSGLRLVIHTRLPPIGESSRYEVWLYNSVTDAMSLGEASRTSGGLFRGGGRLPRGYAGRWLHVDVSLESRRSGRKVHSGASLVRGDLRD